MTSALKSNLSRQTSSTIQQAMKRAFSAERSLASTNLAPNIREALKKGHKLDVPTVEQAGMPAQDSAAKAPEAAPSMQGPSRLGLQDRVSNITAPQSLPELHHTPPHHTPPHPRLDVLHGSRPRQAWTGVAVCKDMQAVHPCNLTTTNILACDLDFSTFGLQLSRQGASSCIGSKHLGPITLFSKQKICQDFHDASQHTSKPMSNTHLMQASQLKYSHRCFVSAR